MNIESQASGNEGKKDSKNTLIIILVVALAVALAGIAFLLFAYVFGNNSGSEPEDGGELPTAVITVIATVEATLVPPTPTATPAPDISFTASRTTINAGEKATLSWSVENIVAVYMYPVGDRFENYPVTGHGSRDVQPYITTSYELLTFNPDNTTSAERVEITVVGGLTNGRWKLQSYSMPGVGTKQPLPGTEITARFGTDGSLSGSGGCNNYSGGFMAFDQTLRISNLTSSKALCGEPEGVMEQEGAFLSLMHQASKMAISAGQLEVFDSSGNRILVFING